MEESKMNTEKIEHERVVKQKFTDFIVSNMKTETSEGMDILIKTVAGHDENMLHILQTIKMIESVKLKMWKQSK